MLEILEKMKKIPSRGREDIIFAKALQEMGIDLPSHQDVIQFAAGDPFALGLPLGAVGTFASLNDTHREQYVEQYCPELKMFFPSLHNGACFGAEPNAVECFK